MNRSQSASREQATPQGNLNESPRADVDDFLDRAEQAFSELEPLPYDDPRWILSPVEHNGLVGDADFWELGRAIPRNARFAMPTRKAPPARRRRARR